jgi:regulator of replication initiation timing
MSKGVGTDEYPFYVDIDRHANSMAYTDIRHMQNLLNELSALREHVKRLQTRGTELVEENRRLKKELNHGR